MDISRLRTRELVQAYERGELTREQVLAEARRRDLERLQLWSDFGNAVKEVLRALGVFRLLDRLERLLEVVERRTPGAPWVRIGWMIDILFLAALVAVVTFALFVL